MTCGDSEVCDVLTETLVAAARHLPDPGEFFVKAGPAVMGFVTQMTLRMLPIADSARLQAEIAREYPRAFARARDIVLPAAGGADGQAPPPGPA